MHLPTKARASTHIQKSFYRCLLLTLAVAFPAVVVIGIPGRQANSVHAFSRKERRAGAVLFHEKGCEYCHGADRLGTKKAPDLSTIGKRWKRSQIEQQILNGGDEMPPFRTALQKDEVKALVDNLRARRKAPKSP
jgi:mono/diheme cytochrome c family protein